MLFIKLYRKISAYFTPLKMFSLILLFMAVINHLYNPFQHESIGETPQETFARFIVLFCGIFGLFGNGKHLQTRSLIVGFPFLYLASLYILKLIQTGTQTIVLPLTIILPIGLWIIFAGAEHERRATGFYNCTSSGDVA